MRAIEGRDDAALKGGDFALREATARRRPRACRDEVSVLDQEVRWKRHARIVVSGSGIRDPGSGNHEGASRRHEGHEDEDVT
jgi:hypothetical protein